MAGTKPGARLAHAYVYAHNREISTLDLVEPGRFLLLTKSSQWARVALRTDGPLTTRVIDHDVQSRTTPLEEFFEIGEHGALLVRPDQHVAWRTRRHPRSDDELSAVMQTLLGPS